MDIFFLWRPFLSIQHQYQKYWYVSILPSLHHCLLFLWESLKPQRTSIHSVKELINKYMLRITFQASWTWFFGMKLQRWAVGYEYPWVLIIIPYKGICVTKFCVGGLAFALFAHFQHIRTHTEKPSITKPQDIKTDYNYPLSMHKDIITLISVSVCHYLLYFFLFPLSISQTSVLQLFFIPLLMSFLRYIKKYHT